MPRPIKKRIIEKDVSFTCFKPAQIPKSKLKKVELLADELEAIRILNLNELSQEEGAKKMGISPSTFNRLVKSAYKKITDALVNGKGIRIYKIDGSGDCK